MKLFEKLSCKSCCKGNVDNFRISAITGLRFQDLQQHHTNKLVAWVMLKFIYYM